MGLNGHLSEERKIRDRDARAIRAARGAWLAAKDAWLAAIAALEVSIRFQGRPLFASNLDPSWMKELAYPGSA